MKRNKAYNAGTYIFQAGEHILVDANIWLYLQPPSAQPSPGFVWRYSAVLKRLLAADAKPVIEALVLSEYLNRYFRLAYNTTWKATYPEYKAFRKSPDFIPVAQAAVGDARNILKLTSPEGTPLSQLDLPAILVETEAGALDFNDGVLVETCRLRGWKLLTNDSDMTLGGIDVLTTNNRLITACAL